MRQRIFQACRNIGIGVDAEPGDAGKPSRASDLFMEDGVAIGNGCLSRRPDVNSGGNAVVQHALATTYQL